MWDLKDGFYEEQQHLQPLGKQWSGKIPSRGEEQHLFFFPSPSPAGFTQRHLAQVVEEQNTANTSACQVVAIIPNQSRVQHLHRSSSCPFEIAPTPPTFCCDSCHPEMLFPRGKQRLGLPNVRSLFRKRGVDQGQDLAAYVVLTKVVSVLTFSLNYDIRKSPFIAHSAGKKKKQQHDIF